MLSSVSQKLPVIDFVAYDLRHAYALRGTVQNKISLPVMARMMGHAPQIHLETYNAWIKDAHVDAEMAKL
jgi:integrase